ncbi:hypothetical protein HAZT_HAZT007445 [Hyalella azteca]|nr:hypothetical protein HAZT_HAZT007445 [Hyalella azteca]
MFTYINVGRAGSLHESQVYKRSSLCQIIEQEPHVIFPPNTHLVASAAFPLDDRILVPYTQQETQTPQPPGNSRLQKEFNSRLQMTKRPLEEAFRLLRGKWQRLKCLEMQQVSSMSLAIRTCCILHNICMHNDEYRSSPAASLLEEEQFHELEFMGNPPLSALQKRDLIAHHVQREAMCS